MNALPKSLHTAPKSWWAENALPLAIVWIVSLLPFLPVLFGGHTLFSSDQAASPAWNFYFNSLRHGELPLWNPLPLGGMPTFDAMWGDASYLPFIVLGFLLPVTYVVTCNFVLHVLIAGFSSYFLARKYFKLEAWIAAALAVAYALNPHFISYIYGGHTAKFHILAWLPLSLYFLLRSLGPTATWKHLLGLGLTVAVFISTSHLQFTYFVMMGYFVVWLYFLIPALKAKRFGEAGSLAVRFWAPLLLGVGLVFFIFYPPMKYTQAFGIRGSAEKTTFEHATSWSIHPEETASLLVPEFGGINENYWGRNYFKLNTESPGLVLWFLGLLGLFAFRTRWFWLWAGIGALAVLYGLAAHTPVFGLFYQFVPGVRNFRAASMMLFWLGIALLAMSGETLRRLLAVAGDGALSEPQRARLTRNLRLGGGIAAAVLALCGLFPGAVYSAWDGMVDASAIPNLARQGAASGDFALGAFRAAALVALLTWAVSAFLLKSRRVGTFAGVLLAVAVVDNYWIDSNFIKPAVPGAGFASEPAIDYVKADTSRFRVFGLPGTFERGYTQYHGIETVDDWTDNEMRLYRTFRGGDYQRNPNYFIGLRQNPNGTVSGNAFLDLLNVKYLAFRTQQEPQIHLVVNASVLPRAFFVPAWEAATDSQALQKMREPGFDPRRIAYVTAPEATSGGTRPDSGVAPLRVSELVRKNNTRVYSVDAPSEGVLVASELWFPHWRVSVDGVPAPVLRADFALRGVMLKPGSHRVEFRYVSPWLRTGLAVSLASAIGLAILSLAFARLGRKPEAA